jgi:23S rRNA pseudouridine2605 synthase
MAERLQKLLARAGLGSRRSSEALIAAGRVRVNGRVAKLGDRAEPGTDRIEVDGKPVSFEKRVYVKLNKPKGVISSTEDELQQGRKTVRDLVAIPGHLYPVGRLDKQSEGLMILTNDGQLAHRLTHPRFGHEKRYRVAVAGSPPATVLDQWRNGVILEDGPTAPVTIQVLNQQRDHTLLLVTMREGRKRQIRRIAAQLGYPVTSLVRQEIGPIQLGDLKPGQWRHLTPEEVQALKKALDQRRPPAASRPSISPKRPSNQSRKKGAKTPERPSKQTRKKGAKRL